MSKKTKNRRPENVSADETLKTFLNRVPPALCRAMSIVRVKGEAVPKSLDDIVRDSGLNRRTVCRLVYKPSWNGIRIETASDFIKGCGISILDNKDVEQFLSLELAKDFSHLNSHQRRLFFSAMGWKN